MSKLAELQVFKKELDREIEKYLDLAIKETSRLDKLVTESLKYVKKVILSGGKRLRPAFMYYGYLASGGKDIRRMLRTSMGIEFIHMFLLIHDDIMDRDNERHGLDSVHYWFSKKGRTIFKSNDFQHFGNSMAIIIGDMVGAMGNQVIFDSGFDPDKVMKALSKLQSIISRTVIGQSQDIYIEYKRKATEDQIMKMYENKTAKYTVEGPLHLGAILGGASEKTLGYLSDYAIPLGIAFQIQDDILGIFGSEEKLGKKVGSDIKEGKQTILVAKAKENGKASQIKELDYLLGNKKISQLEIERFKSIIRETGSLDYAVKLSRDFVEKAKNGLESADIDREAKKFLAGIADYMIKREM